MIGKTFFGALAVAVLVASASLTAVAQVGELRCHVWMQQADGQKVPLADAQVDVFRTDMSAKYNTKTNKKGEFVFAGLPFVGTYTVAASHPTASPNFLPGVKAGRELPCDITLTPGNGKRLTFEEIKGAGGGSPTPPAAAGGSSSGPSEADKAKIEELKKKNAEIESANKKITEANDIIARTFKAGNEALQAAVYQSHRYIPDRFLPDKAIDVIDEAGARVKLRVRREQGNLADWNELNEWSRSYGDTSNLRVHNEDALVAAEVTRDDVEDVIAGRYTLEVSSPGLDRKLLKPSDYERFRGRKARIKLRALLTAAV